MGESKKIFELIVHAKEKAEKADRLFKMSNQIYINIRNILDKEIRELEEQIKISLVND